VVLSRKKFGVSLDDINGYLVNVSHRQLGFRLIDSREGGSK
jgi:hypothetical protein